MLRIVLFLSLTVLLLACGPQRQAPDRTSSVSAAKQVAVVSNDSGGLINEYIKRVRATPPATLIAFNGDCFSACTLYLAHRRTCADQDALFWFHGPSKQNGQALSPADFERDSRLMARYYPEPLRSWFLETGRTVRLDTFFIKPSSELIAAGITSRCVE